MKSISRRSFVGASALAAAAMTAGCAPESSVTASDTASETAASAEAEGAGSTNWRIDAEFDDAQAGEWVPVSCWTSCGGRCLLKAYVVDGMPMRIKTDDIEEDSFDNFQNRACPRGRAQRMHAFGADRIKYPMKRKNWQPGGGENAHGELRGKDEWERISWDEAFDLCATEIKRIVDEYGPMAINYAGIPFYNCAVAQTLLPALGGYTWNLGFTSYGSWTSEPDAIGIDNTAGEPGTMGTNDRLSMLQSDLIVLHGNNPVHAAAGSPALHLMRAHEAGIPFVFIGPDYNPTAAMLEARWIPVRPTTDAAFLSAVIYELLQADGESGDLIDWDFLYSHTVGFDDDHMPDDAKLKENVRGYVEGAYDDTPKTAEWAADICGCSADDIRWYAEQVGRQNKVSMYYAYSIARNSAAATLPQLALTLACMGAHVGADGQQFGPTYHFFAHNCGPNLVQPGEMRAGEGVELPQNSPFGAFDTGYRAASSWKAMAEGHGPDGQTGKDVTKEMRMIWCESGGYLTSQPDVNSGIKAFRKMDFVLTQAFNFKPEAQFSDIVLPASTPWEYGYDQLAFQQYKQFNRESFFFPKAFSEPLFESKPDVEIAKELAKRLGLDAEALWPYPEEQRQFERILNATVCDEDGVTYKPLVSITQERIEELGFEGEAHEGVIDYDELRERGVYHVARKEGDNYGYIAYKDFVDDPEGHPLKTASGKWELYCQTAADAENGKGLMVEIKPYGCLTEFGGYFDEKRASGEFPLMVYEPHYLRRAHTTHDNVGWLRQAFKNPVYLSAADAAERGIESGDIVEVESPTGKILRIASVVETLMPGCVGLPHGSWPEVNEEKGVDENGCENSVTVNYQAAGWYNSYHDTVVEVRKHDDQSVPMADERSLVAPAGIE
ncbi:molybdopterin-dependent oxidoreductase [Eggerthellaceae bacterium zg-887]|uniref:molybdopterin-dependent oxidoreductase n=1 Tax=Xiamenia xianingshaonis TaxID=2682776 RepID=UPI001409EF0C|nr:molybdopterin-dependent oxidoreductase [Xiamenia xianingshaonis]NHM15698.1 molybdopterin-dependent oxidoreductase [Xiamenia xianingshaonis]